MVLDFPSPDPALQAIGSRLHRWREARGVSLEALSAGIGVSEAALGRAEHGQSRLTAAQLYRATLHLHIPMRLLFEDAASPVATGVAGAPKSADPLPHGDRHDP